MPLENQIHFTYAYVSCNRNWVIIYLRLKLTASPSHFRITETTIIKFSDCVELSFTSNFLNSNIETYAYWNAHCCFSEKTVRCINHDNCSLLTIQIGRTVAKTLLHLFTNFKLDCATILSGRKFE